MEATIMGVMLTDPWPARVRGGAPTMPISDLPSAEPLPAGTSMRLLEGESVIGIGIADPENEVVRLLPSDPSETLDRNFFARRVRPAIALRRRLGLLTPDGACRLINGEGDGLSGFVVDYYAHFIVIYTFAECFAPWATLLAEALSDELAPTGIIAKVRPAGETPVGAVGHRLLVGVDPPKQLIVTEAGVRYEVHLLGGLNTGLFCDMRDVRVELRHWLKDARVLNTFSYTGSFSVIAALAGAREVVSVDFAAGVLQWTKTNFVLNGLQPDDRRYSFVRRDVFDFLKEARRERPGYEVIILDPPAVSTVPGRRWFMRSDYDRLVGHALKVLAPGGLLVAAASSSESRPEKLENQIRAASRETGHRLRLVAAPTLPGDFPTQMIAPQSRHLKCYFLLDDA